MPGKVMKFSVAEGDKVRKNQTLAVVEATKMENEIKSPGDGTVKESTPLRAIWPIPANPSSRSNPANLVTVIQLPKYRQAI